MTRWPTFRQSEPSCLTGAIAYQSVVSYVFLSNFPLEIGARPVRMDPLAHARRLSVLR